MRILDSGNIVSKGRAYIVAFKSSPKYGQAAGFTLRSLGTKLAWSSKVGHGVVGLGLLEVGRSLAVMDLAGAADAWVFDAGLDWDPPLREMADGTMTADKLEATTDELAELMAFQLEHMSGVIVPDDLDPVKPYVPDPKPTPAVAHGSTWIPWALAGVAAAGLLLALAGASRS